MTEAELSNPDLQAQRHRLDIAKLTASIIAAVAATAALAVALPLVARVGSVTSYISDCTTPTGRCYHQQQQRNAENRARLVDADVAVEWCGRTARTLEELHRGTDRVAEQLPGP